MTLSVPDLLSATRDRVASIMEILLEWRRRARDRAMLAEMEPRMLRDVGITEDQRRQEIAKPFWRA